MASALVLVEPSFAKSVCTAAPKLALTRTSPRTAIEQVAEAPLQAPSQPRNLASAAGMAVKVTVGLPAGEGTSQGGGPVPQSMPPPVRRPGPARGTRKRPRCGRGGVERGEALRA